MSEVPCQIEYFVVNQIACLSIFVCYLSSFSQDIVLGQLPVEIIILACILFVASTAQIYTLLKFKRL